QAAARRLSALSYCNSNGACWLGPIHRDGAWSVSTLEAVLADGHAGIALFLSYLAAVTGRAEDRELARKAAWTVRIAASRASTRMLESLSLGWLDGWGGVIYALAHIGKLTGEQGILQEARALVARNLARVQYDSLFSVADGTAGLLAAVLAL